MNRINSIQISKSNNEENGPNIYIYIYMQTNQNEQLQLANQILEGT